MFLRLSCSILLATLGGLAACGGDEAAPASSSAAPSTSAAGTGGSGGGAGGAGGAAVACPTSLNVAGETAASPGASVTLEASLDDAVLDAELTWTVSSGSLSAPTGAAVSWLLPTNAAVNLAETLVASVAFARPDCAPLTASLDVAVDHPESARVLVLYNPSVAGSEDVATYYAAARGIPTAHLCPLDAPDAVTLDGATFPAWHAAFLACRDAIGPHVHYVVPVYGVPYKVSGRIGDIASPNVLVTTSLDALLAFGEDAPALGAAVENPLYRPSDSVAGTYSEPVPFGEYRESHPSDDPLLVARIDGADADAAKALVDRTMAAEALAQSGSLAGTVYVDGRYGLPHPVSDDLGSYEWGEHNIAGMETVFAGGPYPVVADYADAELGTAPAPLTAPDALYYAGWYSFGNYNDAFTWAPGAIGGHLDSCSACDIRGTKDWSAMALRKGITATFGAVNEPYVVGMPDYDELYYLLLHGANFGEAAYQGTYVGAWMMVFVGDPLYRPHAR